MFLAVLDSHAGVDKFNATSQNWPTPSGGAYSAGTQLGYNTITGVAGSANGQSWTLVDMNGDKKPDLVITAGYTAGAATELSGGWKVHLNTGAGFSNTVTTFATPTDSGIPVLGMNAIRNVSTTTSAAGTSSWDLVDMNGDGKPDLVFTGVLGVEYSAGTNNTNWQVYLNNGGGFASTAITWPTPSTGTINAGNNPLGFSSTSGTAVTGLGLGSESWGLVDVDGDGKPDLVVTGSLGANGVAEAGIGTSPKWEVYLNTGTGFAVNPTPWSTPAGGAFSGANALGFNVISGTATSTSSNGSQSWSLMDMDGDKKPDLVVTAAVNGGSVTEIGTNTWNVYLNNGSGFAATATTWATPGNEGFVPSGGTTAIGFNGISNIGVYPAQGVNSQSWLVTDLNGDGKPDLVIPASLGTQGPTEWSPGTGHWEVYLNTGTGFDVANVKYWSTPNGGETVTGNNGYLSFNYTEGVPRSGAGDVVGSSNSWITMDLEGNGFPDLVLEGTLQTAGNTENSATSNPYWIVYRNAGAPADTAKDTSGVSIRTIDAPFACKLYPNPNNGNFKLQFADNVERVVEITDVTGQTLISNLHVAQQAEIAMPAFAQGIYFVTIRENGDKVVMMMSVTR